MLERGHEVIACAGGKDATVEDTLLDMGVHYVPLPLERTSLNPLSDLRLLWKLMRLMRKIRPDMVLTYTIKPVIYGMLIARLVGVRQRYAMITGLGYTFISSTSFKPRLLGFLVRFLYRFALAGARAVFFQNNDDLELFCEQGLIQNKDRTQRIMGSGVDLDYFSATPLPSGPLVFLLIARLLTDKGIREFVDAARMVRQVCSEPRFAVLGPFDNNPAAIDCYEVEQWVNEGVVDYWGETDDVRPYLERCSVFVLPSYREGMPRSVLEAMAMGRPIITTDVPGCRDTVDLGINGYLVAERDATALAKAMHDLAQNDSLDAMGKASRRLAEQHFGVESVNRVLLEVMGL
jgi:glycosyltransferase involved in cell wall biosynthesis